jgi:hypothetical protein
MKKAFQKFFFILLSMVLCFTENSYAQSLRKVVYSVELGGFYSINNKIPFWLRSNQFGAFPNADNTVLFRQNIESKKDTSSKKFKKQFCADMVTIVGSQSKIIIPEAYYLINYGKFTFLAGRKKQIHGLVDSTLSSGSITWSGNALPLPEIQISIPEYTKIFFPFLAFKGHYSHGWFGNQASAKDFYLHQKSLYLRMGRAHSKLKLYGGILHNAQWGGTPKYEIPEWDTRFINGKFPQGWYTYRNVVFPFNNPKIDSSSNISVYDSENRFGNHLGQIDMGGDLDLKRMRILFYKQIVFETGQTFSSLSNIDDGLYGISFISKNPSKPFKKVVFEVLQTTNQGMYRAGILRLLGIQGRHYGRNQNFYFNHGQYTDGWSYNGFTIGSPFLIPNPEIRSEKRDDGQTQLFSNNNNIKAAYIGIHNKLNSIDLETRISFSRNFGSSNHTLGELGVADQFSMGIKAQIPAPKLHGIINFNVGIEHGDLIYDNYGVYASFKRIWK